MEREEEIFKEVKNYPRYEISNHGRLRNKKNGKILKDWIINGYRVGRIIGDDGKHKKITIHRLVALNFCENPNNHNEIDHISRNREDNYYKNLRWCSHSENCKNKLVSCKSKINKKENEHHIYYLKKSFTVRIYKNGEQIYKNFKNLDDAIKFRDEQIKYLNEKNILL